MIPLDRPLTAFDVETTGTNTSTDRIVQIAIIQIAPDGARKTYSTLVNPQRPIPPEATEVHGITDAMVQDAPTFFQLAPRLINAFRGADYCGFNVRFDLEVCRAEFERAGISTAVPEGEPPPRLLDPYVLWTKLEPRTLAAAVQKFLGRDLDNAHDALADIEATVDVLDHMITAWLPKELSSVQALHDYAFPPIPNAIDPGARFLWRGDEPIVNFGKHRGATMRSIDAGFWRWMLNQNFPADVKRIAQDALRGVYPVKEGV